MEGGRAASCPARPGRAGVRRLRVERIELLQLHRIDPETPLADQLGTLGNLRDEGKIGRVGLSEVTVAELEEAPTQVALAWLLSHSPVMLPIPGTARVDHLEENLAAAGVHLTPAHRASLDRLSEPG